MYCMTDHHGDNDDDDGQREDYNDGHREEEKIMTTIRTTPRTSTKLFPE